jgi:Arc/MetJ-type ribon-helix-helix transcriptional regulator
MKVLLTKELEHIVQKRVETGLHRDAGELIRNAINQFSISTVRHLP